MYLLYILTASRSISFRFKMLQFCQLHLASSYEQSMVKSWRKADTCIQILCKSSKTQYTSHSTTLACVCNSTFMYICRILIPYCSSLILFLKITILSNVQITFWNDKVENVRWYTYTKDIKITYSVRDSGF